MKQQYIDERIKELQNDSKYSFKQTSEIIELIYKLAISDCESNNYLKDIENQISSEINKNVVNNLCQSDELEQSELKIKKLNKTIDNLNTKIAELSSQLAKSKTVPKKPNNYDDNDKIFQSGLAAGLKYAMMSLEGRNVSEAWSMIMAKYDDITKKIKTI